MTNDQVRRMEDFVHGRMDPGEQKNFEQELASDTALLAAYKTYHAVHKYMFNAVHASEDNVKNTLNKLGAEFFLASDTYKPDNTTKQSPDVDIKPGRPRIKDVEAWKWAAAVFILLAAAATWYLLTNNRHNKQVAATPSVSPAPAGKPIISMDTASNIRLPDPVKYGKGKIRGLQSRPGQESIARKKLLFAKYFTPDATPANDNSALEAAFDMYKRRQYKDAATAFENAEMDLSTRGQEDARVVKFSAAYYKAVSYMATGRHAAAITQLKNLTNTDLALQAKVDWYLALAYLANGNTQSAVPLLSEVGSNKEAGKYALAANKLLAELNTDRYR